MKAKEDKVTDLERLKMEDKRKKETRRMLKRVDKELRRMEFQVNINLGNMILALTDRAVGNHKLIDVGFCG